MNAITYRTNQGYSLFTISILFLMLFLLSCSTPAKHLEKGHYQRAINQASKEISKGKNVESNIDILNEAGHKKVDIVLDSNYKKLASAEVEDWITVQNKYYATLADLGKANKLSGGELSEPYDRLCEQKNDLDFKIAKHYYNEGTSLLAKAKASSDKRTARNANYKFLSCKKYGGETYYQDLEDKEKESFKLGVIYYTTNDNDLVPNDRFLIALPRDADRGPDCVFSMSSGLLKWSQDKDEKRKNLEEEIEISKTAVTDSTGLTTFDRKYETAYGTKVTTTTKVTLSRETTVKVRDVTGDCFVNSRSFTTTVSNEYEETRYEGDSRSWPTFRDETSGEPPLFRHKLEDELNKKIENEL